MVEISTANLRLTLACAEDWEGYAPILQDPATARYSDLPRNASRKRCESFMGWMAKLNTSGRGRAWMIRRAAGPEIIGAIRFNRIDRKASFASVGYELAQAHWGQGLMSEAVTGVAGHGFDVLSLFRLEAWTHIDNAASRRVLERTGFQLEGVQRQKFICDGARADLCLYARLWDDRLITT